jgi:hypothetical protein
MATSRNFQVAPLTTIVDAKISTNKIVTWQLYIEACLHSTPLCAFSSDPHCLTTCFPDIS